MAKKKLFIPPINIDEQAPPGALDWIRDSRVQYSNEVLLSDVYQVEPESLIDNEENPELFREESQEYFETLEADIKERGILVPLIARQIKGQPGSPSRDKLGHLMLRGRLLAGHNRLVIARRLGLARVPVQFVESELTPEQERALVIKDNLYRRQLTQEDRIRLYRVLIPDFDKRIQKETRGGDHVTQGAKGKPSRLLDSKPGGLTAAELAETAQAAGLDVSLDTVKKDIAKARRPGRPKLEDAKPKPAEDPAQEQARRLKTVKAHCDKIIESLNGAEDKTNDLGILQVLDLLETLAGENTAFAKNIEAIRAALQ